MDADAVALDFRTFVFGGVGMYPGKQFTQRIWATCGWVG
jgi:hypothetical protein